MKLNGQIVLVTRPQMQSKKLIHLLQIAGANAQLFTPITILPKTDCLLTLDKHFLQADWVFFVSPSAIDVAAPYLNFHRFNGSLFCVGQPSAEKLRVISGKNVYHPEAGQNDTLALLSLPIFQQAFMKKVLIIRGEGGRADMAHFLHEKGAHVYIEEVYQRHPIPLDWAQFFMWVQTGLLSAICVTSSEIAQLLFKNAPQEAQQILKKLLYLVPHVRIQEHLQRLGAEKVITCAAGDENMVKSLIGALGPL
ncbi:uroporphyrinogen-III synthase [Neisseria sp. Ec49-e6-T10]|uniref:uroporphyrinogen-III synthase n=1 Tax=Neisseria sp. Ec49-e6-T10 TaxID=3140744 RepID=UPI003EB7F7D2